MEQEQWKPIQEFNGEYEVSNLGRVRSMKRYYGMVGRIMPQTIQRKGYYAVTFHMNNKAYCRKVHRLVIEAFTPNPDSLPCINHIDGNKLNNHVSNLEWCTYQANMQHAVRTGLTHPHQWTDDERKQISERNKQYAISHGYQPKPHRTMAEYQAERRAKAEERKRLKALQPKKKRGRPSIKTIGPGSFDGMLSRSSAFLLRL